MALRNSTLDRCDLVITGTGSLACHVGLGLACGWGAPLRVAVLGRSDARVDALVRSLNCRATTLEQPLEFVGRTVDWGSDSQLRDLLWTCRPRTVLHTASLQSPWSLAPAGDAWSRLVMEVGFGLTLPLHSRLAIALAEAAKDASPSVAFVNACYPDAVNAVLKGLALPVTAGVGNVGIMTAALAAGHRDGTVKIVAHHNHVATLASGCGQRPWSVEPIVTMGGARVAADQRLFETVWTLKGQRLNTVTSSAALRVVRGCLGPRTVAVDVPGPLGRPGGYPVEIHGRQVKIALPPGVALDEADRVNRVAALADGLAIDEHSLHGFSETAAEALRARKIELPDRFSVTDMQEMCKEVLELRTRLAPA